MAESSTGDKTEKASAHKLRKAREKGQVARSRDWVTAVAVLASLKLLMALTPGFLADFRQLFAQSFAVLDGQGALDNAWSNSFYETLWLLARMVLPLALVPLLALAASLVPGGWAFSAGHLAPQLGRLNPLSNLGRLASGKHWSDVAIATLKAATLIAVLWHVGRSSLADYLALQALPLDRALLRGAELMGDGVMALAMVFVVFALIDLPVQTFFFLRSQRMSKQDLKEEHKQSEGRPEVRQRIRQLQRQLSRRSLRKSVPSADVVVVNPEHYAVALKYDEKRAAAPYVVAKGVDEMALYIRELAAEHRIEVLELPPLARALYNTSQVHQQIPATLYYAVAQVLGYVLQLRAFQDGRRRNAPMLPELAVPPELAQPRAP